MHISSQIVQDIYDTPLFKIPVENAVGEPLPADADALQDAVTAQLVQDKAVLHGP